MKSFKTEIHPTEEQKQMLEQMFGNCRWVYNQYIIENSKLYEKTGKFLSGYDFSKQLNNNPNKPEWLKLSSSKSIKKSIMNAESAFKRFFKKQSKYPKLKTKKKSKNSAYFCGGIKVERHRIQIPKLKKVRLKEYGYIPTRLKPKSATISKQGNRYFIAVLFDFTERYCTKKHSEGIGIDLGIKEFATCSNEIVYQNINKTVKIKKIEKNLRRQQKKLSRKYKQAKKDERNTFECKNLQKQKKKVQEQYRRLSNMRADYQNKVISDIIKRKPSFITLEKLNIAGMLKNKNLSKSIAQQSFSSFKEKLVQKAIQYNIEVRQVDTWFPSTKTCSECNTIKQMSLSDRIYECDSCGLIIDRDLNASLNLKRATKYTILT